MYYSDDSILAGPCLKGLFKIIRQMKDAKLNITVGGTLEDFLEVNIDRKADGTIHLAQPHIVESIPEDLLLLQPGLNMKTTPSCSSRILQRHKL